jgi:hypothetical protein
MKVTRLVCAGLAAVFFIAYSASAQDFTPALDITLANNGVGEPTALTYTQQQDYGELDCDSVYTTISEGVVSYDVMSPSDTVGDGSAIMAGGLYNLGYDLVVFSVNPVDERASLQGIVSSSNHPGLPVGSVLYHMEVEGNFTDILITEWSDTADGNNWTMGVEVETNYDDLFTLPYADSIDFSIRCVSEPDNNGITHYWDEVIAIALGVSGTPVVSPRSFSLSQNYPNPFNSTTRISYEVPVNSQVVLKIYNTEGRLVRTLVNGQAAPGTHHVTWNGLGNTGTAVSTGVYIYRLRAGDFNAIRKMVYLK